MHLEGKNIYYLIGVHINIDQVLGGKTFSFLNESGISCTYLYLLLPPVVAKELGDEPRGP